MLVLHTFPCIRCSYAMSTQRVRCPGCLCDYSHLLNPTSPKPIEKKEKHFEIVLHGTVSLGDGPGRKLSDVIVSYVPEVIASGVSKFWTGERACSGVCIIAPASAVFGHPFPAMDEWIKGHDSGVARKCVRCSNSVPFGHPFCATCYTNLGSDWRTFIV